MAISAMRSVLGRWDGIHAVGSRHALLALIATLFVIEYQLGLIHHFSAMLDEFDSTLGSVAVSAGFSLWIGGLVWGVRRRVELAETREAMAAAEADAETAGICDGLTGLPNRAALRLELAHRLERIATEEGHGVLIGLDVDRFKMLNDVNGHSIADRVLQVISDRLALAVAPGDFVARVGPDEFLVICDLPGVDEARCLAARMQSEIAQPLWEPTPPFQVQTSYGVTALVGNGAPEDVDTVIRRVDIALQNAKIEGGAITVFHPDMELSIRERAELEHALEQAVDREEIEPWFQPVIDLGSNRIRGFEVLARWTHPERGPISPSVFVPIAEERGLLGRMTMAMLRRAATIARDWPAEIKIAINISPIEFKNRWLAQEILQTLTEVGFPPRRLEIEITENALVVDHDQAVSTVMSLKNQGISIALDDFGTGYASLHQLRVLPFDKIMIDQSFVRTMVDNSESRSIVQAIIGLSGSLGLPTTAEGIETESNAQTLRDLGCTLGQGFLFSRAVPAEEAAGLVAVATAAAAATAAVTERPSPRDPDPSGPSGDRSSQIDVEDATAVAPGEPAAEAADVRLSA